MQKTSLNLALLIFTTLLLSLTGGLNTLPVRAVVVGSTETFTLQIDNELTTNPDKISLCENGVFRKGWDGAVKGRIVEPGIDINSNISIHYGTIVGTDCTTAENVSKKVKELSSLPRKYAANGDEVNITLSGSAVVEAPTSTIVPELGSPATSGSANNTTLIKIVANPALTTQPQSRSLCVDNILLTEASPLSGSFVTTSGVHSIKFAPATLPADPALACSQVPVDNATSITIADGQQTNITARNRLDYKAVKSVTADTVSARKYDAASPKLFVIDPEQRGIVNISLSGPNSFTVYNPLDAGTNPGESSKIVQGKHFKDAVLTFLTIEYDPATSLPDDEFSLNEVPVKDLFGGVIQSPNGVIRSKNPGSGGGLGVGKLLQNPINLSLGNKNGHVSLIKRAEISTVVSKSIVKGEHIKSTGGVQGYVSNSPFVPVPTSYTVNAQGDYVVTSSFSGAVGQYVLVDTLELPNDPAGNTNGLIRTGGNSFSQQNNQIISLFAATILSFGILLFAKLKAFKKR
jgi:hypothetical protein